MKLILAIMAASAILAMTLAIMPAEASIKEGSFIEEPENESIERQLQIASEVSQSRQQVPEGYNIINETVVGDFYVAYIDTDDVETVPCGEDVPECGGFTICFRLVHDYHVVVHKLGSNQTEFFDPGVWALGKEYGKG